MNRPLQIVYRDFERTESVDDYVHKQFDKLLEHAERMQSCRVAIESPHKHKLHGRHFRVRIDMTVPGAEIVVDRSPDEGREHENAYAAIDDAFEHAVRRLTEHARRLRDRPREQRG